MQVILLYTEGVLIAQYVFLIPTRLECDFLTEEVKVSLLNTIWSPHGVECNAILQASFTSTYGSEP